MKTVDVAIVWNTTAAQIADDFDTIPIPDEYRIILEVVLAGLKQSPHPDQAKRFLAFAAGDERWDIFHSTGYCTEKTR